MGTYGSPVTSCLMISCGKSGANASGPTGSRVPGWSGGSSPNDRSGTRLYQLSGSAFSSSRNFVVSTSSTSGFLACQPVSTSACQLIAFCATMFAATTGAKRAPQGARMLMADKLLRQQDHRVADRPLAGRVGGAVDELFANCKRRGAAAVEVDGFLGAQSLHDERAFLEARPDAVAGCLPSTATSSRRASGVMPARVRGMRRTPKR